MIRPVNFTFNEETASSNSFQQETDVSDKIVNRSAQACFDELVDQLRLRGINVEVFEDKPETFTPDSIFPNNWISLHHSGKAILYPMEAENRRLERRPDILAFLRKHYDLDVVLDFSHFENDNKFLEGTGSIVLDRIHRIGYACISSRTNMDVLKAWQKQMNGYELVTFNALDAEKKPIYHTNVMMCMGDTFCVVCLDAIPDLDERLMLKQKLELTKKEIIEISFDQMLNFAGNMLMVKNNDQKRFLIMSDSALKSLTAQQISNLEEKAEIIAVDLGFIETLGGGSARCMIAEIHLPKK